MDSNNIQASTHVCLVAKTFHLEIGSPSSKKKKKNGQEFSVCQQNSKIMAISFFFNRRVFHNEIKDSRPYDFNCCLKSTLLCEWPRESIGKCFSFFFYPHLNIKSNKSAYIAGICFRMQSEIQKMVKLQILLKSAYGKKKHLPVEEL